MEDLYLKENPFNIPNVDANVESFVKESKVADVEASKDDPTTHCEKASDATEQTENFEKGNSEKTLISGDDKAVDNLRVDDKNDDVSAACKNVGTSASNMASDTNISKTIEIPSIKQNVVSDASASLGQ
jgi:cytochrome c556